MMGLAEPPHRWDAETTTAAALEALRPAVDPISGSMVKADVTRLEPWIGFKNGCVATLRQGVSCAERVRSQFWESEMDSETFANEAADWFAERARGVFSDQYEACAKLCESEIERILLAAIVAVLPTIIDLQTHFSSRGNSVPAKLIDWLAAFPRAVITAVVPQATIGSYRVDFLICMQGKSGARLRLVVECDGHDYHERTKKQAARDRKRDRDLQALGYRVMRFTGSEICRAPFDCAQEVRDVWLDFEAGEAELIDPRLGAGCRNLILEAKKEREVLS